MRRRLAWWGCLTGALLLLHVLGRGRLALPAPWHGAALLARVRADGAEIAAVAALRLLLIIAGAWLVVLSLLSEVARLPGLGPVARRLLSLPLPGSRSVLWRVLGAPAVAVGITGMTMASAVAQPSGPPVAVWVGPPPPATPGSATPGGAAPGSATSGGAAPAGKSGVPVRPPLPGDAPVMHLLPAVPPAAPSRRAPTPASAPGPRPQAPPAAATPTGPVQNGTPGQTGPEMQRQSTLSRPSSTLPPATDAAGPPTTPPPAASPAASLPQTAPAPATSPTVAPVSTYTLVAGDHLWAVATKTLTARLGRPPEPEVLAHYWWQLVEANRSRLPDPSNPDYVRPGLTVVLP